ncbi:MAG: YggT family protein [Anaerolineaceae bacterium]|nr:YggT family protein [Anaerolineaceae bacterium]
MSILITTINAAINVFSVFIIIYSLLSFVLDPSSPIRQTMAQVIEPLLMPIRKIVPAMGGFDFSPLILMVLIQVVGSLLIAILRSVS